MTSGAVIAGEQAADGGGQRTGEPAGPVPITLAKALNLGLRSAMAADPKVIVMGEDVGTLGGVFRVTDGLLKEFGEARVIDTPLAESAIVGTAIGLAMRGYRPVCEIQFDGFVYPAFDQIVSQLAKLHYRSAGRIRLPVTIRIPFGGGIGAVEHHSESPEAYFCHTAGLKVVACSNPADAHQMIQQAIRSDDPVIFLEPKRRYWEKAVVDPGSLGEPSPDATGGLHSSAVARAGTDATLVGYGPTVRTCLDAAEVSAADDGRSLEVVDLRSLSPLDLEPVLASVRRTGRLVVVHEAPSNVSVSAEVAARVTEQAFYSLEAPVLRVTGFDTPYPPARLEDHYLPDVDRILDAVDRSFGY
ncbi:alpha-ketoacid dehydrogenase subunit beta [Candidatus Frankia alpina]|uniref:alpha-ketoacid dehydrogenase subunit beta n=1 Tax=Candidatus Frankia alpina TaxID=2699483 RepID=UPI0013D00CD4|nr:alpha-ketoacid dehydrogenase subunit beta [Candidatus Frankia alpina]